MDFSQYNKTGIPINKKNLDKELMKFALSLYNNPLLSRKAPMKNLTYGPMLAQRCLLLAKAWLSNLFQHSNVTMYYSGVTLIYNVDLMLTAMVEAVLKDVELHALNLKVWQIMICQHYFNVKIERCANIRNVKYFVTLYGSKHWLNIEKWYWQNAQFDDWISTRKKYWFNIEKKRSLSSENNDQHWDLNARLSAYKAKRIATGPE